MRVLIVDDEVEVAGFLKHGLEEAGVVADTAHTGLEGEYLARLNAYDVLVLDVTLPDKDGRLVCRDLRSRGIGTPALVLTVRNSAEDRIIAFNSGADQCLPKPFEFAELLARVRSLGRLSRPVQAQPIHISDFELDPLKRMARRSDTDILLTTKEYQLLELLARNAGHVVMRTVILERVWDMQHDPTANSVDALVKQLRDKIDRHFDPKLIQTVRGVGYLMRAH